MLHRLVETRSVRDLVANVFEHDLECLAGDLVFEQVECPQQRHAGLEQVGKL